MSSMDDSSTDAVSELLDGENTRLNFLGSCKVAVVKDPTQIERGLLTQYLGVQPLVTPICR
jgi:hypothetical protein